MKALWYVAAVLTSALVLSVPSLYVAGIWLGEWRFTGIATVLLFCCAPVVPLFGVWTGDHKPYARQQMPRADRKRLRDEQRRIALEKAIRDAEKEAGL